MMLSPTLDAAGLAASDDEGLASLFDAPGPFVTAYLDTQGATENASQQAQLRWKDLRRSLAELGAPSAALDAIEEAVPSAHLHGRCLAAVANESGLLLARHGPEPPKADAGHFAELPQIGPMLAWRQADIPYLLVLADHAGADIFSFGPQGATAVSAGDPDPHDPVLHRAQPGGWSQPRYQRRAKNAWRANAQQAASAVAAAAERNGARFVALAGNPQSKAMILSALPKELSGLVREIGGGRHPDGGAETTAAELERLVATEVAAETTAVLRQLHQGVDDLRRAVGVRATTAALVEARVELLVVHDDPAEQRSLWFGPLPNQLGENRFALEEMGVAELKRARLPDVAIRAAFGTGARVRIVPKAQALAEGLGAVLRYGT